MKPQLVMATLEFLSRTQLSAKEIPAFNECVQELQKLLPEEEKAPSQETETKPKRKK